jgi:hypothetical protein
MSLFDSQKELRELRDIERRLVSLERSSQRIIELLLTLTSTQESIMGDTTNLLASVARESDLIKSVQSAQALLTQKATDLQAQLDALIAQGNDQEAIDAAQAKVDENNAALEAIVAAASNTPAATP